MDLVPEKAALIAAWASSKPTIDEMWLFGSRARGDAQPDCDTDLGVRFGPQAGDIRAAIALFINKGASWQKELTDITGDIIDLQPIGSRRRSECEIARDGILLWSRNA